MKKILQIIPFLLLGVMVFLYYYMFADDEAFENNVRFNSELAKEYEWSAAMLYEPLAGYSRDSLMKLLYSGDTVGVSIINVEPPQSIGVNNMFFEFDENDSLISFMFRPDFHSYLSDSEEVATPIISSLLQNNRDIPYDRFFYFWVLMIAVVFLLVIICIFLILFRKWKDYLKPLIIIGLSGILLNFVFILLHYNYVAYDTAELWLMVCDNYRFSQGFFLNMLGALSSLYGIVFDATIVLFVITFTAFYFYGRTVKR